METETNRKRSHSSSSTDSKSSNHSSPLQHQDKKHISEQQVTLENEKIVDSNVTENEAVSSKSEKKKETFGLHLLEQQHEKEDISTFHHTGFEFEQLYLDRLPCGDMYEKSYMHRGPITHTAVTRTDFLITASSNGQVKFWKKQPIGIEFVKQYLAHQKPITSMAASADGLYLCTVSSDKTAKVFDILNFDMINILKFSFVPKLVEWVYQPEQAKPLIAVTDSDSSVIRLFNGVGDGSVLQEYSMHQKSPVVMKYNSVSKIVVSCDESGVVEYWDPKDGTFPTKPTVTFEFKSESNLYEFAKAKTYPVALDISDDGKYFVTSATDHKIRVFRFASGKLTRTYDESLKVAYQIQKSGPDACRIDEFDFGKRMAVEKAMMEDPAQPPSNVLFDKSGNFIIYPTLFGIKGKSKGTGSRALDVEDPTLVCAAYNDNRFYLFSRRDPEEPEGNDPLAGCRDVFNEKPSKDEQAAAVSIPTAATKLGRGATLHTTYGDIHMRLFPDEAPKAVENFTVHSRNGYFNNLIFHRVVKGFMIQTGDPLGDGRGGNSIWRREFEDEFHRSLRHDRPFTVSMANAGPNTNGSQFFITTVPTNWLDNKHTIFGRVVGGTDVVRNIELAKVDSNDKPYDEIKMTNITILYREPDVTD